jgi:hypothetical protein
MALFRLPEKYLPMFKALCNVTIQNLPSKTDNNVPVIGRKLYNAFARSLGHKDHIALQRDSKAYGDGKFAFDAFLWRLVKNVPSTIFEGNKEEFAVALDNACLKLEELYSIIPVVQHSYNLEDPVERPSNESPENQEVEVTAKAILANTNTELPMFLDEHPRPWIAPGSAAEKTLSMGRSQSLNDSVEGSKNYTETVKNPNFTKVDRRRILLRYVDEAPVALYQSDPKSDPEMLNAAMISLSTKVGSLGATTGQVYKVLLSLLLRSYGGIEKMLILTRLGQSY